jgi:hypothetical protein
MSRTDLVTAGEYNAPIFDSEHEIDQLEETTLQRNLARHALLKLVDEYTVGNIEYPIYKRWKVELQEKIFSIEAMLREQIAKKRSAMDVTSPQYAF